MQTNNILTSSTAPFILPNLSAWQKSQLMKHAEQVLITQHHMLTKTGKNILHHTLQKKRKHIRFNHYPKGDRIDYKTGGQYFYHCHRENKDMDEHGHFHCYLRQKFIPKHIKPRPLADWDKHIDSPMAHLIAIGMNRLGQPIRLFTVNRWVTSETWYDAKHAPNFIKRFKMTLCDDPYWQPLDQWVEGMLHLFAPQITWLHQERDARMAQHANDYPNENIYEYRDIDELSEIPIDLQTQVEWIMNSQPAAPEKRMVAEQNAI